MRFGALSKTRHVLRRANTRHFACITVEVNYGTVKTSREDLRRTFEPIGKVWDVLIVQSTLTGKLLNRAIVRFYSGDYRPADMPDAAPVLPPPTEAEIREVEQTAKHAAEKLDRTMLNNAQIRVFFPKNQEPTQLHEWYESVQASRAKEETEKCKSLFPINPFIEPHRDAGDDYRQGFMTGFKLGLKDGSKPRT
ncbi:hypothetical protein FB645_002688 [Coemansia sp. IMI 203386]|nr:hypothetical protein FB645_002688 [Coemansia sp. IMI 203386]